MPDAGPDRVLFDRAPCGHLVTAANGTIVEANETFCAWIGHPRADLVGSRRFADLLTGGGRIHFETHLRPTLAMQGEVRQVAVDLVAATGLRRPALVTMVRDDDTGGDVEPVVRIAVFDAADRRGYEEELLAATRRAEASEHHARSVARTLQQILIPPAPPAIPDLDVGTAFRPAGAGDEIGGDFYDLFAVGEGEWVVVIGDVCGKGVEAAGNTALVRHTVRAAAVHRRSTVDILADVNLALLTFGTKRHCTVALARMHATGRGWRARVAAGGHPLPLLHRAGLAPAEVGRPGTLLGMFPDPTFHEAEVELEPDDRIVLYTDGVVEGRRGADFYGETRLAGLVERTPGSAQTLATAILDDVLEFQAADPADDTAIVVLRVPSAT
jgi:sigma-B regulation protein RsbU (phosphoserine phosphatase)